MRVHVGKRLCQGHGRCHALAPEIFDLDGLGHSIVKLTEVSGELAGKAKLAERACPERAIFVAEVEAD